MLSKAFKSHKVEIMHAPQDVQSANIPPIRCVLKAIVNSKFIKVMIVTCRVVVCHNLHVSAVD